MPRKLWGEFKDDDKSSVSQRMIPLSAKRLKLEEMQLKKPVPPDCNVKIELKNPLVTQTIEVMNQTEMLQSLIDTYSNKSGSSHYLLNPCQMIPGVDFPPENVANFVSDDKFAIPFWFIPPNSTDFTRGIPRSYPFVNAEVSHAALRKAAAGHLRMTGFTDTTESALVLFTDAIEEFVRTFMEQLKDVQANNGRETQRSVSIPVLEKAYFLHTSTSLTHLHNFFKHHLIARNRAEVETFKSVFQEYDRLMKESERMQKDEFQRSDFMTIHEMPTTNDDSVAMVSHMEESEPNSGIAVNMMDTQDHIPRNVGACKKVFQGKPITCLSDQRPADNINISYQSSEPLIIKREQ